MAKINMKEQTFGVEVELVSITREKAAKAVAKYFDTIAWHAAREYGYDAWACKDRKGRTWKFMRDSSLTNPEYACEIVTPICGAHSHQAGLGNDEISATGSQRIFARNPNLRCPRPERARRSFRRTHSL